MTSGTGKVLSGALDYFCNTIKIVIAMQFFQALIAILAVLALTPVSGPQVFAPFELSNASIMDIALTKDGQTMYATLVRAHRRYAIVESQRIGGRWTAPHAVSFSGQWRDLEEVLAPDSSYMIFASNRPAVQGGKALDSFYYRRYGHARGGNLWIVKRVGSGWGTPARLPDAINANTSTFSPALASDGTLYFMRASGPEGRFHLFVSRPTNGEYRSAQLAPFADHQAAEFDPTVAPDDSFAIFASTRAPLPHGVSHLFISYNHGGTWSRPADMGQPINAGGDDVEARLSPDLRELYYSSAVNVQNLNAPVPPKAPNHVLVVHFR